MAECPVLGAIIIGQLGEWFDFDWYLWWNADINQKWNFYNDVFQNCNNFTYDFQKPWQYGLFPHGGKLLFSATKASLIPYTSMHIPTQPHSAQENSAPRQTRHNSNLDTELLSHFQAFEFVTHLLEWLETEIKTCWPYVTLTICVYAGNGISMKLSLSNMSALLDTAHNFYI